MVVRCKVKTIFERLLIFGKGKYGTRSTLIFKKTKQQKKKSLGALLQRKLETSFDPPSLHPHLRGNPPTSPKIGFPVVVVVVSVFLICMFDLLSFFFK